jgi:cytochrome c553
MSRRVSLPARARVGLRIACGVALTILAYAIVDAAPPGDAVPKDDDKAWVPGDPQFGVTAASERGEAIYETTCAGCHDVGVPRAPAPYILRIMPPSAIYRALTTGAMRVQGQSLADEDRRAVAEYLSGRAFSAASQLEPPACTGKAAERRSRYRRAQRRTPEAQVGARLRGRHACTLPTGTRGRRAVCRQRGWTRVRARPRDWLRALVVPGWRRGAHRHRRRVVAEG